MTGYDAATGRVIPKLEVNAGPKVLIEATGAKVSSGRLKRLLPIFEEQSVDQDLLVEGARDLTEYFQTKGYFDAKVEFTSHPVQDGRLRILYSIDRGERHKLVRLEIAGNGSFDLKTIRERMFVAPSSLQMRRGRYSANLLQHDLDAITELYRANGFRDVKVGSQVQDDVGGKPGNVAVSIGISAGDRWYVASASLEGVGPENEKAIRSMLQSGPGQSFSEANVAVDRDNILAYYFNRGYPNAYFEWSYREAGKPGHVDLRYVITEGPQHFVREVLISGLRTTHPQLVNRQIGINVGDPVSQSAMLATQRRLYDLGIFAKVEMAIQNPEGDEPDKFVLLQLEESRKYSSAFGFGAELGRIGGSQTSLSTPAGTDRLQPAGLVRYQPAQPLRAGAHRQLPYSRFYPAKEGLVSYTAPQIRGRQNLDLSFTRPVRLVQGRENLLGAALGGLDPAHPAVDPVEDSLLPFHISSCRGGSETAARSCTDPAALPARPCGAALGVLCR